MSSIVDWYGEEWFLAHRTKIERGYKKMLLVLVTKVKKRISRTQPTVKIGDKWWGLDPSKPGEPPKIVTGTLRANIGWRIETSTTDIKGYFGVKVGPADDYGMKLEKGFHGTDSRGRNYNLLPRPYLLSTLLMHKDELQKVFVDSVKSGETP